MLHKRCTGRISANTKPHQLCWIDRELILSKRYSSHNSTYTQYSSLLLPPPPTSGFLHCKLLLQLLYPSLQRGHLCSQRLLHTPVIHICKKSIRTSATGLLPPLPSPPSFLLPPSPSSGLLLLRDCCFFMDLCSSWYFFSYSSPRSAACSSSS